MNPARDPSPESDSDKEALDAARREIAELKERLREAQETIDAIRSGDVDALVIGDGENGRQIYTLEGADRPYRLLIEQMQEGAMMLAADGAVLYCNHRLAEMLDAPHERVVGAAFQRFVAAGEQAAFERLLAGVDGGGPREFTLLVGESGSAVPVRLSLGAVPGSDAPVFCCVVTDLSQEKERLQMALKAGRLGSWEFDVRTSELTASNACKATFGRGADDPFGYEDLRASIHPDDRQRMADAVAATIATGADYDIEYRVVWPDGSLHWVQIRGKLAYDNDGAPLRMSGVSLDATDRKRAEAALRESEERYRLILESATDYAIIASDLDEKVTTWNTGAARILGWQHDEILGRPVPLIWIPEDLASGVPEAETAEALAAGRAQDERWHLRKDGSRFWANGLLMPLRGDDGALLGFLKILRDRTAEREAEERRELLINELNHRVKNSLATVQSVAVQTLRNAKDTREASALFEARLMALARAHDVLTQENWEGARLKAIVAGAIAAFQASGDDRFDVHGPDVWVSPQFALALAMAVHELGTNAVKYGALSNGSGRVEVVWSVLGRASGRRLVLGWRESDGPPVKAPERRGFGSRLIERSLAGDLGGEARLDFAPTGLVCTIETRLDGPAASAMGR
jgi:PAS domain S-box-containing protein